MKPSEGAYFDQRREDVYPFLPPSAMSFLDVGCSLGGFGHLLRERRGASARIVGIEPHEEWAKVARGRGYDEVLVGLVPDVWVGRDERVDCVAFNDVLEHMVDPWGVLTAARDWLTSEGVVVASIPSISYFPVVRALAAKGRWDYVEEGTLDRTHLRFFTKETMVEMFEQAGFVVESVTGIHSMFEVPDWIRRRRHRLPLELRGRLLGPVLGDRQWLQFVVVARPA